MLGIVVFTALALALLFLIWRIARREGIVVPVAVAFGVRLVLTVVLQVVSVANGHGGFFYLDDHGYAVDGRHLAHLWSQGHPGNLLEPLGVLPNGGPLFYQTVAGVFLLTHNSVFAMKIVDVLAGTGTVLCAGILGNRLLGTDRGRWTAWGVAFAPTIIWWTLPMLREPMATFFAAATLAAAVGIPRWRNVLLTMGFVAALAFTRSTLFVAIGAAVVLWSLVVAVRASASRIAVSYPTFQRVGALVLTAAAVAVAGVYMAGGLGGNAGAVASASIKSSRAENRSSARLGHKPSSSPESESTDFQSPLVSGVAHGGLATYASAGVRFFVSPRAWAFTTQPFDWYQPLYPAMWLWYLLIPVALFGVWRMRRRLDFLVLAVVPIAAMAAQYTLALNSGVRQRSGIEALFVLLIVAGWVSWGVTLQWASLVLLLIAPLASLDLHSPWPALGLIAGAVVLFLLSRRLGRRDTEPPPPPPRVHVTADMHPEHV